MDRTPRIPHDVHRRLPVLKDRNGKRDGDRRRRSRSLFAVAPLSHDCCTPDRKHYRRGCGHRSDVGRTTTIAADTAGHQHSWHYAFDPGPANLGIVRDAAEDLQMVGAGLIRVRWSGGASETECDGGAVGDAEAASRTEHGL